MNDESQLSSPSSLHAHGNRPSRIGHETSAPDKATLINRTRTGCRTCRSRKVKCSEEKPVCAQCRKGDRSCEWPTSDDKRRSTTKRAPATACDACRMKKLRCVGELGAACGRCSTLGIECIWPRRSTTLPMSPSQTVSFPGDTLAQSPSAVSSTTPLTAALSHVSSADTVREQPSPILYQALSTNETVPMNIDVLPSTTRLGELPQAQELKDLVDLYFSSVHHFGYFAFIHELHFQRLLNKRKAPRELTLMMIASAVRFAADASPQNLQKADAWADAAIATVVPRIYQGFGVIQLMTLLLAQHYDLNRGNFSSAWLLGANCTRMMQMMSLHTFDRTYSVEDASRLRLSPLLSCEALRRVAWATFYVDTMVDGGRYGFNIVDENGYRLQLPCDQAFFLANENVTTEFLIHKPNDEVGHVERISLDMSAYLLRTAAARRRALHFAFRASHAEKKAEELALELAAIELDIQVVISALPKRFQFSSDNMFLHRDRLITFLLLHILRHNLFIVLGRAALQIYSRDVTKSEHIPQVRRDRISHALPVAGLILEGLKANIHFDPQIGVQAYVALEILLFEPRRLAEQNPSIDPNAPELLDAIPHLLAAIRKIANRSEFVKQLHIEAVHRLLRCGCSQLLIQSDMDAFHSEYRLVGQEAAEYDFRDFRWAKLERLRRGASSFVNMVRDEALLEYRADTGTTASSAISSPRLDAMDVGGTSSNATAAASTDISQIGHDPLNLPYPFGYDITGMTQDAQLFGGSDQFGNFNQHFPLDWNWLLGESGPPGHQSGDPTTFWNQLQQT